MKDSILQPEVNNIFRSRRRWISKGELISGSIWYFLFPKTWSGAKSGRHVQHPPFQSIYIYILLDSSSFFHLYKWHTRDYNATTDSFPCHDRRWTLIAQRPWIFWSWRSPGTYDKWVEVGIFCGNLGETRNLFASICYYVCNAKDEDTRNFLGFHELH